MAGVGVRRDAVVGQAFPDLLELRRVHEKGVVPGPWPAKGVGEREDRLVPQPDHRERAVVNRRVQVQHLDDVGGGRVPVPDVHDGVVKVGAHGVLPSAASLRITTGLANDFGAHDRGWIPTVEGCCLE
jgi:hypothetical protein